MAFHTAMVTIERVSQPLSEEEEEMKQEKEKRGVLCVAKQLLNGASNFSRLKLWSLWCRSTIIIKALFKIYPEMQLKIQVYGVDELKLQYS